MEVMVMMMRTEYTRGPARVVLEGVGQQKPGKGDDVVVGAIICLPTTGGGFLLPDLQYGDRVMVGGEALVATWGRLIDPGMEERYRRSEFHAPTWKGARRLAVKWVREQTQGLIDAIAARQAALVAAGDWEE